MRFSVLVGASIGDHGDAVFVTRGAEATRFLGRQIDDDHAVHPGVGARRRERFLALLRDRIRVAEEDDRHGDARSPQRPHIGEADLKRHAVRECGLRAPLDDNTVRERVREGHAELDDVRARRHQRGHDRPTVSRSG